MSNIVYSEKPESFYIGILYRLQSAGLLKLLQDCAEDIIYTKAKELTTRELARVFICDRVNKLSGYNPLAYDITIKPFGVKFSLHDNFDLHIYAKQSRQKVRSDADFVLIYKKVSKRPAENYQEACFRIYEFYKQSGVVQEIKENIMFKLKSGYITRNGAKDEMRKLFESVTHGQPFKLGESTNEPIGIVILTAWERNMHIFIDPKAWDVKMKTLKK